MRRLIPLLLLLACFSFLQAQTDVCLSIENENGDATAGYYEFEVYVNTKAGSLDDIYLATSDFRIAFEAGSFTNPNLEIVPHPMPDFTIQAGYCNFLSTAPDGGINDALLRQNYHNLQAVSVSGNMATINLNSPNASSSTINSGIAVIEETAMMHRLGRYRLTGYTGGNANLSWLLSGVLRSRVFSFGTMTPFNATETTTMDCSTTAIEKNQLEENHLVSCYPNPASGSCWFEVDIPSPQPVKLIILDQNGRQIRSLSWLSQQGQAKEVSLNGIATGVYAYQLIAGDRRWSGKLMIR